MQALRVCDCAHCSKARLTHGRTSLSVRLQTPIGAPFSEDFLFDVSVKATLEAFGRGKRLIIDWRAGCERRFCVASFGRGVPRDVWVQVLCCSTCRQTDGRADDDNVVSMMRPPCRMQFLWPPWAPCGDNVVSMVRHLSQIQHLSPTRFAEQSAAPMVTSVDTRDDDVSALVANLGAVLVLKNTWLWFT